MLNTNFDAHVAYQYLRNSPNDIVITLSSAYGGDVKILLPSSCRAQFASSALLIFLHPFAMAPPVCRCGEARGDGGLHAAEPKLELRRRLPLFVVYQRIKTTSDE